MQSLTVPALNLSLGALQFGDSSGERCLALHGWMDNAASFGPLALELPEFHITALDLPGHGHSTHLPEGCHYHLLDNVPYVLAAADELGWPDFNLVAHSLGACIAPFVAVAAPERVKRLVMIDGIGPPTESGGQLPERIKRSVEQTLDTRKRLTRIYARIEDAVAARLAATQMEALSARLVVERSLVATEGGYTWRFDSKIRLPSPSYLSDEQVQACLAQIECPGMLILAEHGVPHVREHAEERLGCMPKGVLHSLPGHHHLHMDAPEAVAAAIRKFFLHSG